MAVGVFVLVLLAYRESPVTGAADAHYTLLESVSLLDGHRLDVQSYLPRPLDPYRYPGMGKPRDRDGLPYQLVEVDGRVMPYYAPGTAVLSAPLLALMQPFGYGPLDPQGHYDAVRERRAMKHIAALVTALFSVFAFLIASELLPLLASCALAVAAAFASPTWSTLSRGLWSHDWFVVLIAAAIWLLVRAERHGRRPPVVVLATLAVWSTFVRPTGVLPLAAFGIYLLIRSRRDAVRFALAASPWIVAFAVWVWTTYGAVVPPYFSSHAAATGGWRFVEGFAGTLVSPSRGVLVFCPWILYVAWLLWRYRASLRRLRWVLLATAASVVHLLVVAASPKWWGGYSYGPRLMSDVLPWLLLLAVLALDARRRSGVGGSRKLEVSVGMAVVVLAAAMHAPAALSRRTEEWNALPVRLHQDEDRLWSWSDPQFLAWRAPRGSTPDERSGP